MRLRWRRRGEELTTRASAACMLKVQPWHVSEGLQRSSPHCRADHALCSTGGRAVRHKVYGAGGMSPRNSRKLSPAQEQWRLRR